MNALRWIYFLVGCLLCATIAVPGAVESSRSKTPNIIFILADDLGYGDLGCYGQKQIKTPSLDRLAAEGIRFTQCYAGSTVCAPSRCVLMTGLHTGHCKIRGNARHPLAPDDVTVAEALKSVGYRTALIGKWGLGEPESTGAPTRQGFDYFYGYLNQRHAHNYYPTHLWRNEDKVALQNVVPNEGDEGSGVATKRVQYSHDLFVQEAIEFIQRSKDGPFFLYLALTIPHANNEAGTKGMEVPDLGSYKDTGWPEAQKGHAAMITRMDNDIGRIMDRLKQLQIDNQTIVFFTSDNGPHREGGNNPEFNNSNGTLRGIKRDLYEGGIRVPAIVRWPGKTPAGTVSDVAWYFADFLPTAAEIAGAKAPSGLDGVSILPTLLGKNQELSDRFLYWEFHERGFKQAVRHSKWKGVKLAPNEPLELYDLSTDIGEQNDVSAQNADVAAELEAYLKGARTESELWPIRVPSH